MRANVHVVSSLCVLLLLLASSSTRGFAAVHTSAAPKVRVTAPVDDTKRATLFGHVPAAVRRGSDLGRVDPSTRSEHMIMVLKSDENQKRELRRVLDEQQDKNTANFHQWATPEEFGSHFGVHDGDIAQIQGWLLSHGLSVDEVSKSKRVIRFSGTIGQVEEAFQTEMHYYLMPNGEMHVSNDRNISVPEALIPVIAGVPTLNDFFRKSHKVEGGTYGKNSKMKLGPKYSGSGSTGVHYVAPGDFATIYNTAPLLAQGINGTGVTIGIVGRSDILLSDVQTYRSMFQLPANDPIFIHAGQDNGINPGDDGESDLDVEISGGVAPGATVKFVIGTPTFLVDGITNSIEYLVENNIADVISLSYGDCEANEGAGGNSFNSQMWEQAAAQGTSVFVAAGDNGPGGCDDQGSQTYEVYGYATGGEESTWYSIAAGGAEFYPDAVGPSAYWSSTTNANFSSALTYIPEYPWNESRVASPAPTGEPGSDLTDLWSGSGGVSAYYLRPPWQTGSGINNSSDPALTLANGATGNWVASVNITNQGSGYTTAPTVSFGTGCTGTPAATSTISGGQVTGVVFSGYTSHYQGFNCTSVPSVTFSAPTSGTTAAGMAVLGPMQDPPYLISNVPHRLTPDLALNAASGHDPTFFCSEGICELNSSSQLVDAGLVGGTSVAAPSMAGVQALIDQANGGRQGMPAYIYYTLANAQNSSGCNSSGPPAPGSNCAFQDITLGNDFICGLSGSSCTATLTSAKIGFAAGTGYDLASGLGSPNGYNLATQWSNVVFSSSNTTLGLSQTTLTHGTSVTLSGTVAAGSGSATPTGDVAFIVSQGAIGDPVNQFGNGALNGPVAFATLSNGTYSASLDNLPGGTYYVTARYGGDENFASSLSAGIQVTVTPEGSGLTITPYALSGSACTITPGNSFAYASDILLNLSVAGISGAGAPTGTVALSLDGNQIANLTLDPNGNAFALSGAVTSSSCIYDYDSANIPTIPAGSHTLSASYSGDNTYNASTAAPVNITVGQVTPTLTLTPAGGATIASGQSISLTGTFGGLTPINGNSTLSSAPTGVVTFTDTTTSTVLGTVPIVALPVFSGNIYTYQAYATLTTTGITVSGANAITASFAGDTNWGAVTSAAVTFTVATGTATTVAVTSNGNPTTLAGRPTFTATVTTATSGSVSFYDGAYYLGSGTVGSSHTATFRVGTTTPFAGGTHNMTAIYQGTGTTLGSVSPVFVETVTQGTNTIDLTAKTYGTSNQSFTFAAVLTPSSTSAIYAPNQSVVNFFDGATNIGSAQPITVTSGQGGYGIWTATLTDNSLSAGTHTITATYSDVNYSLATSNAQTITVGGTQTISFGTQAPASAGFNNTFTVAATASSGLAVAYTSFGSCTNSGATYTMTNSRGSCLVIANQSGNSSYGPAPEVTETVSATTNATSISVTSVTPSSESYGQDAPVTITAVLSWTGNAPTPTAANVVIGGNGNGTYSATSCGSPSGDTLTCAATYTPNANDTAGTYTETAKFSADSNYTGSSSPQTNNFSITAAGGEVSVQSSGSPSTYGQNVTFTATINGQYGQIQHNTKKGNPLVVTGTVSWSANTGCGTTNVTSTGPGTSTATCTTAILPAGSSDQVTADYNGDSNHTPGSGFIDQAVSVAATSIGVTSVTPSSEDYGSTAQVAITAQLTWSGNGSAPTAGDVTISGSGLSGSFGTTSCGAPSGDSLTCSNTYTPSGTDAPGSYTMSASFSGDGNYSASSSSQTNNFTINTATSTTTVTSSGSPSTYGTSVTFTATINGENGAIRKGRTVRKGVKAQDVSGMVTWSGNTGCSASTVSGYPGVATCTTSTLGVGTDTVTASYGGDSNHQPSSGSFNQSVTGGVATSINVTGVSPAAEDYGSTTQVAITAVLSWTGSGAAPTASDVSIGGSGLSGSFGTTSCGAPSGDSMTCSNTYSPSGTDAVGSYTISAAFSGDSNYGASSSPQINNFTINLATTTTSVVGNPNPSTYSQQVTFTATINAENGNIVKGRTRKGVKSQDVSGTVTWSSNTGCSPSAVTGGYPGVATCTTSAATHLPVGTDPVTATYSGDSNHSGSMGSENQQVNGGIATSINVNSVSPASESYGQDATATITAELLWTGNGRAPTASNITISGNGNGTYSATSCNPRSGDTITCTATYTPTAADVVGSYTETAAFSGDINYAASNSTQTNNFTITQATSSTSVGSSGSPTTYGQSVTFTATVDGENGATKRGKPGARPQDVTGTVTWSSNTGCSASTVSGYPGVATCTTSSLNAGSDTIKATYSGDANHTGSSGTFGQTVNKASQTITATPPSEAYKNDQFMVSATGGGSGETLVFTSSGPCSNSGSTYLMGRSGTCTGTINQPGNTNYLAAQPYTWTTTIITTLNTPSVSVSAPTSEPYGASFVATATYPTTQGVSGGVPTITATGSCTAGAVSGSGSTYQATVTMTSGTGTCTTTAKWAANFYYAAATTNAKTTASRITPVVNLNGVPSSAAEGTQFTVTATSNESGTYAVVPTITASGACEVISSSGSPGNSQATIQMIKATGTCTTTAKWAASTEYAAQTLSQKTTAN